nr:hypothetical protein [Angustibacter aerolatus]
MPHQVAERPARAGRHRGLQVAVAGDRPQACGVGGVRREQVVGGRRGLHAARR